MIEMLKTHLPQCFDKDGKLIAARLKESINELIKELEINAQTSDTTQLQNIKSALSKESYALTWLGSSYAKLMQRLPANTLIAQDFAHNAQPQNAHSKNVLIRGDNLEVLKHLKNAYYRKVKAIYIDPPYNTGSGDFIYKDERDFTPQSLAELAGIEEGEAKRILEKTLNKSSTHSAWLSFMHPRLHLAKALLRDDGVIFISIDDNEQANLKLLCDSVFGDGNFVSSVFVLDNLKGKSNDNFISNVGHKILVYARNADFLNEKGGFNKIENIFGETIDKKYKYEDDLGVYTLNSFCKTGQGRYREDRPTMYYPILFKDDYLKMIDEKEFAEIYKDKIFNDDFVAVLKNKYEKQGFKFILPINENGEKLRWTSSYNGAKILIEKNDLVLNSKSIMQKKRPEAQEMLQYYASGIPKNLMYKPQYANGTDDLKNLFGKEIFSYPKPIILIKDLLQLLTSGGNEREREIQPRSVNSSDGDIILDFFAGSGTTAQAVMELNAQDNGNRAFILVQLDEQIDKEKSKTAYEFCKNELKSENPTIFDITKERIIRAAAKIKEQNSQNTHPQTPSAREGALSLDLGFKIYELTPSIKASESNLYNQFLSDEHKSALLETFRLQNSVEFSVPNEKVILQGAKDYECVRVDDRLFLLNGGFKSEHLRALLEKIDTDEDFVIKEVIYLNNAFESARIRELEEGLKSYSNKKGLVISVNARCL